MKSILDPSFKYVSSLETDLRKTFARIRRERTRQQKEATRKGDAAPVAMMVRLRTGTSA